MKCASELSVVDEVSDSHSERVDNLDLEVPRNFTKPNEIK